VSNRPKNDVVRIFDTTLRDGEQSPGASLTSAEKVEIARQLGRLGVDIIEAGFPAASPDDHAAVTMIAREIGKEEGPVIAGLARAHRSDIDAAWSAVQHAAKSRIHTFLATSDLHMQHKLQMSREEVVARVREMVAYARSLCEDVEFSPEDGSRSDPEFLVEVLTAAIEAGATTLNVPDTVGYAMPEEYGQLISRLIEETPGSDDVIWSVHCHDDLGVATANTIAGIRAGARQAEVTVNGIGERAGNTSLEEVVMAFHTRQPLYGLTTHIKTHQISRTSRMVSSLTGMPVPPNKAIVGSNAFAHEAGIHQHGMLQNQQTYEIMTPETVGVPKSKLVLGKHSGRHAFRARLEKMGYELTEQECDEAFRHFKDLADRKKTITDADLQALVTEEIASPEEIFSLIDLQVACGRPGMSTATVRLNGPDGVEEVAASVAPGPIDAAFHAIDEVVSVPARLVEFDVHGVTAGKDALGEATVRIAARQGDGRFFGGYGADTDIIIASAKAYLAALNRLLTSLGLGARVPKAPALGTAEGAKGGAKEVPHVAS
jgi:2-isopropylmalate synthase